MQRKGRSRKVTVRERRDMVRISQKSPFTTAIELAKHLETVSGKDATSRTVENILHDANIFAPTPRRKLFTSKVNRDNRLAFAKERLKQPTSFWKSVIFSDESKFNLFRSDGKRFVWRKHYTTLPSKNLLPTVKHGGGNPVFPFVQICPYKNPFLYGIFQKYGFLDFCTDVFFKETIFIGFTH